MICLALYQPDIAANAGTILRLGACFGVPVHIIHPAGFALSDRTLRRAGMDYWRALDVHEHDDFEAFLASDNSPPAERIWLFTTHATASHWSAAFADGDGLLFGKETAGVPDWLHDWASGRRLQIPRYDEQLRSLNLATSAGIATYEALRQIRG